eukprot:gb/GEZN01000655.1/.p1 GENE.gb/GEZN01000655.1/~~gb/GEZN01000655.1/.p1  ORF type:complete len:1196 (+),score=267.05 gb/GEZN01000655.1/:25-3612(+)
MKRNRAKPSYGAVEQNAGTQGAGFSITMHPAEKDRIKSGDESAASTTSRRKRPASLGPQPDYVMAVAMGLVNAIIVVPVLVGFAHIIFRDQAFVPCMGLLTKAVLLSSTVHQLVFTCMSTMDFAVGQVQDAGLIFLCAMSSGMARQWREDGGVEAYPGKSLISTVTVGLSAYTALLGLAVVITGKLRLATYVQLLPVPVVGGYLAFIGFFCLEAGLAMMAGVELHGLMDWAKIWQAPEGLLHTLPGVALGACMLLTMQRFRHLGALGVSLLAIPSAFYLLIWLSGSSLQHMRDTGWVGQEISTPPFYEMWLQGGEDEQDALYQWSKVQWSLLPRQFPQWIAMYLVVAFSSSLDVAAIELDIGESLDYDHELVTVGWSNFLAGLLGGYTGSYIFSQTILTRRANTHTRLCGCVLICCELIFVVMPYSILGYFPKCFFGSVLCFIGFALMSEWLVEVRAKVSSSEYALVWLAFLSIHATNLELGLLLAVTGAVFHFLYLYAVNTPFLQRVRARSDVLRGFRDQTLLMELRQTHPECIQSYRLRGHIFFASAVTILQQVKESVVVAAVPGMQLTLADSSSAKNQLNSSVGSMVGMLSAERAVSFTQSAGTSARKRNSVERRAQRTGNSSHENGATDSAAKTLLASAFDSSDSSSSSSTSSSSSSSSLSSSSSSSSSFSSSSSKNPSLNSSLTSVHAAAYAASPWDSDSPSPSPSLHATRPLFLPNDPSLSVAAAPSSPPKSSSSSCSTFDSTSLSSSLLAFSSASPWALGAPAPAYFQEAPARPDSECSEESLESLEELEAALAERAGGTRFVIFDFKLVTGIDVTAVRSCFLILRHLLGRHGATMLFANLSPQHARLFRANGVLDSANYYHPPASPRASPPSVQPCPANNNGEEASPNVLLFPTCAAAVEHAENELLRERCGRDPDGFGHKPGDKQQSWPTKPIESIVASYFRSKTGGLPFRPNQPKPRTELSQLREYFKLESFAYGEDVFAKGDPPNGLYFVASGEITLHCLPPPNADGTVGPEHLSPEKMSGSHLSPALTNQRHGRETEQQSLERLQKLSPQKLSSRTGALPAHNATRSTSSASTSSLLFGVTSTPSISYRNWALTATGVAARGRFLKILPGGLFGDLDYFVQKPRSYYATATKRAGTQVWFSSIEARTELFERSPELFEALRYIALKSLCASSLTLINHEDPDD